MKRLAISALLLVLAGAGAARAAPAAKRAASANDVATTERAADAAWAEAEASRDPATRTAAFRRSAELYLEAHELEPRFSRIRNAASAWKHAGDDPRAADALETALGLTLTDADRAEVERLLVELRRGLGRLTVRGPRGSRATLAQAVDRPTPFTVHLAPGRAQLEARFEGGATARVDVVATAGKDVELQLIEPAPAERVPITQGPSVPTGAMRPGEESEDDRAPRIVAGGILVGVGGALAISTVTTAIVGKNAYDEYRHYATLLAADPGDVAAADAGNARGDEASTLRTASWITGVTGGACLVAGIVVLATAPAAGNEKVAHAAPCAVGAGLGVCGAF